MRLKPIMLGINIALLSACAVGPDFEPPVAPDAKNYTEQALPEATAGGDGHLAEAQHFVADKNLPADWWQLFGSDALNALVAQALKESPQAAIAEAKLKQAQESLNAAESAFFPRVDANLGANRQKFSPSAMGLPPSIPANIFNLYNASVDVSYRFDLLGGVRRAVESREARAAAEEHNRRAIYLMLAGNVVTAAFHEAALRTQIDAMQKRIVAEDERITMMEKQLALGAISQTKLLAARDRAEQLRAMFPPLNAELARVRHQLTTYIGKTPQEGVLPEFSLEDFSLPQEIPVSLPSNFVRQRPDILVAEAQLKQANADLGVATANMLPQLNIDASFGPTSVAAGDLFEKDSLLWSAGAGLTQPIFRGGELSAKRQAAVAMRDEAAARYQETVLSGFQNVADSLKALEADAEILKSRTAAFANAKENLTIAQRSQELGGISKLQLIDITQRYEELRFEMAGSQAARLSDTVALFQSLGGGWWNSPLQ